MKIPKRLDLDRACFYQLPAGMSQKELVEHELDFRREYGLLFHSRSEDYYFFQLPHTAARDAFLTSLEISCQQIGFRVERQIIYTQPNEGANQTSGQKQLGPNRRAVAA